jgi:hypothetical protein
LSSDLADLRFEKSLQVSVRLQLVYNIKYLFL